MKDGEELKAFLSECAVMHDTGKKRKKKRMQGRASQWRERKVGMILIDE